MRLLALAALLPYLAFGGSLQEALLSTLRLNQNLEVGQCNIQQCQFPGNIILQPGVNRTVEGCCSSDFNECGAGDARCRLLAEYVIPESSNTSSNVEVCPAVPEEGCTCQTALSTAFNVSIRLCPTPKNCCQSCRCIGDPHCVSFEGQPASFVVCDVRDGNCEFPPKNQLAQACSKVKFNGIQCVVRPDKTGRKFCQVPANVQTPSMVMYTRTYETPTGQQQIFNVSLQLSIYGSIENVFIRDGANNYKFSLAFKNGKFSCVLPPNLAQIASVPHLTPGNFIHLDKLQSGVLMTLQCIILKSQWGTRWEVPKLLDDFAPDAAGRGGFCQTGVIPESSGEATSCVIDRRLLGQFEAWGYRCIGSTTFTPPPASNGTDAGGWSVTYCKRNWCDKPLINTGKGKNWQAAGFNSEGACEHYVGVQGDNFLRAVCSVAPGVEVTHPAQCDADAECRTCMDNLKDFPEQAADILQPGTVPRSNTGGVSTGGGGGGTCNRNSLLELGLQNAEDGASIATGGVKILYQAPGETTFIVIWLATDADIAQYTSRCGCVNFLQQSSNVLFTAAGTYRIQQCFPETQFVTNNCQAGPTYNLAVNYPTTPLQADFSFPFGQLVDSGQLVCSQKEQCPPGSQCCIWQHGGPGWRDCLGDLAVQFPNCGKKTLTLGGRGGRN